MLHISGRSGRTRTYNAHASARVKVWCGYHFTTDLLFLAYREGLEPPTPGFGDPCSAIGATGINETGTHGRNRTFVIALSRRHSTIELHGQISECHVLMPSLGINLEFRVEVLHFSEQLVIIIIVQKAKLKKNLIVFCICVDELHTAPS